MIYYFNMDEITQKLVSLKLSDKDKEDIIIKFLKNVKNVKIILDNKNEMHSGKEGHWLEKQMGIQYNNRNEPDINGYEMKKDSNKITFGDFSASEYLFSKKKPTIIEINKWNDIKVIITRNEYIHYFGSENPLKNNRYSWSGTCVPKYNKWNNFGQNLLFNENNDICIYYSYSKDKRDDIKINFPKYLQKDNILIALWKKEKIEQHINRKFNNKGFFICKKINDTYQKICFGKPFDYTVFIEGIKNNIIIFDSGMYEGNSRNYSQFRSSNSNFWNKMIIEEY